MSCKASISCGAWLAALLACGLGNVMAARGAGIADGVHLGMLPQTWQSDRGTPLSLADFSGERVVLTMAYANCHRVCPMTLAVLIRLQAAFDSQGTHAEFVVVGYDPENENPATWRQYRRSHHLERSNWHFVTGPVPDTAQLARQLHFELWKYDEHVMHDSRVLVFDTAGVLVREIAPTAGHSWDAL